ncbi:hypothetical protein C1646_812340 [Rhizophagus diaphanus]|nr:hypothetical protein C1646_812340 [Rhizophagus diaphanus] [Rhizophagus sp. MUCL 43196]
MSKSNDKDKKDDIEKEVNIAKNSKTSGNSILDEFIEKTQLNSKCCDDFIEWIPRSNLENIKFLTNGGNSKIYYGTWSLLLNMSLASMASNQLPSKVVLKAINNNTDNINNHILNEGQNYNNFGQCLRKTLDFHEKERFSTSMQTRT